jgi:hypothetical protein
LVPPAPFTLRSGGAFQLIIYFPATMNQAERSNTGTSNIKKAKANMNWVHSWIILIRSPRERLIVHLLPAASR